MLFCVCYSKNGKCKEWIWVILRLIFFFFWNAKWWVLLFRFLVWVHSSLLKINFLQRLCNTRKANSRFRQCEWKKSNWALQKLKVGSLGSFKVFEDYFVQNSVWKFLKKCVLKLTRGSFMEVPVCWFKFSESDCS